MAASIQHTKLLQKGNKFEATFKVDDANNYVTEIVTKTSQKYVICGLVVFQVRTDNAKVHDSNGLKRNYTVSANFSKINHSDRQMFRINFSSNTFSLLNKMFVVDEAEKKIFQMDGYICNVNSYSFDVTFDMDLICYGPGMFAAMHDDEELTDFELRGENGSVKVHKAIMAGYSPTLKALFSGEWKETATGSVQVKATVSTLQHLKDYVYLQKLPEQGVKELLALASYYMMSEIQQKCSVKLLYDVSAENYVELLEFAVKYEIKYLFAALMKMLQSVNAGALTVDDILESCSYGKMTEPNQEIL